MTLSGKTILITRPVHQSENFIRLVERLGGIPVLFPTIEITPPASWDACDRAIDNIYMYDGLILTSSNGAEAFVNRMIDRGNDLKDLRGKLVYVVGEKTKHTVEKHGCAVTAMPEKFTALELSRIIQQEDLRGKCFLFARGNLGNSFLADSLKLLGAQVDQIVVYETTKPAAEQIDGVRSKLLNGEIDFITFTSPSTVTNFCSLFSAPEIGTMQRQLKVAVIGPVTAEAAEDAGFTVDVLADQSTIESMVESIARFISSQTQTRHSQTFNEQ
jgi:uroporphyrinogen-III synthase